jgi:hypothetical protein
LREAYKKMEEDFTEREVFLTGRISKLKEWQGRAINELKFLTNKLKFAVPLTEYERTNTQMELYKGKTADLMERCNRLTKNVSDMQTKMRNLQTAEARLQLYEEM